MFTQILITRDTENSEPFGSYLRQYSFAPFSVPLIRTSAIVVPTGTVRQLLEVASGSELVWVFSSPQGVLFLAEAISIRSVPQAVHFVAQGEATGQAVLRHFGRQHAVSLQVAISPVRTSQEMGQWLLKKFPKESTSFVIIGPKERSRGCEDVLRAASRVVGIVSVYETKGRIVSGEERQLVESFYTKGMVVFFSPSAVLSWVDNGFQSPYRIASFGPVTSAAIVKHGLRVAFEAPSNSLEEFARTLGNQRDTK
jgi:uroporphyrinogen-III synthase